MNESDSGAECWRCDIARAKECEQCSEFHDAELELLKTDAELGRMVRELPPNSELHHMSNGEWMATIDRNIEIHRRHEYPDNPLDAINAGYEDLQQKLADQVQLGIAREYAKE